MWWTQFLFWITNLRWKLFGFAWKRVRSVLDILTHLSLYCSVSILGSHLADCLLILMISVKTVYSKPELMHLDLVTGCTVRFLLSKTVRWMVSTWGWHFWTTLSMITFCDVPTLPEFHRAFFESYTGRWSLGKYQYQYHHRFFLYILFFCW